MNAAAQAALQMLQQRVAQGQAALKQIEQTRATTEMLLQDDMERLEALKAQLQVGAPAPNGFAVPPGYQLVPVAPVQQPPPGYQLVPVQPETPQTPVSQRPQRAPEDHPAMRPVMLGPAGAGVMGRHGSGAELGAGDGIFGGIPTDGSGQAVVNPGEEYV